MSVLPAIIGAGASLVGGLINNQYAQARSDEQWDRMNYMQDKMNAYNAPSAQMARLREAGLNPNLVYANGGAVIQSAVGNAPNPPNSVPIDTQGVLQMVQTIVGAMLEKDKIQAQKDMQSEQIQSNENIAEAHNVTQKDVTEMQTSSNEKISEARNTTDTNIAEARNKSNERNVDVQTDSNERIAEKNRMENARQFDLDFAHRVSVDNARLAIDRSLANSTIALQSSQVRLNDLSAQLSESVQPYLVDKAKYESLSLAYSYGSTMLENFLALPQYIGSGELGAVFDKAGLPRPAGYQLESIADFHNKQFELWKKVNEADFERADAAAWYAGWNAFFGAASGPFKMGIQAAALK